MLRVQERTPNNGLQPKGIVHTSSAEHEPESHHRLQRLVTVRSRKTWWGDHREASTFSRHSSK